MAAVFCCLAGFFVWFFFLFFWLSLWVQYGVAAVVLIQFSMNLRALDLSARLVLRINCIKLFNVVGFWVSTENNFIVLSTCTCAVSSYHSGSPVMAEVATLSQALCMKDCCKTVIGYGTIAQFHAALTNPNSPQISFAVWISCLLPCLTSYRVRFHMDQSIACLVLITEMIIRIIIIIIIIR